MRGNLQLGIGGDGQTGSIPAYAGEPTCRYASGGQCRVYPRVCGGTVGHIGQRRCPLGLSPRMRGNRPRGSKSGEERGSIPAYAGEPNLTYGRKRPSTVYPRVCGGTRLAASVRLAACGLSPRMRGNLVQSGVAQVEQGSIPAYAGEPNAGSGPGTGSRVYPRVCGGTAVGKLLQHYGGGLSPRMRGNPPHSPSFCPKGRSIPAYAGEPPDGVCSECAPGVYPRVCGGTRVIRLPSVVRRGLSPRMRGNRLSLRSHSITSGSIPAYAGEPDAASPCAPPPRVYPRVCGGTPSVS